MNWHFMDRYLLTATLRRDGSSRFSSNNRWGTFPSVAFAWTVLNEPWMEPARDVLSNLKLRIGYGVTGQQEIGDYLYMPTYSLGTNPTGQYLGSLLLKPNGYSPDLKWEETTTYNLGLDFGFLNNRITGTLEYYDKRTKDLLNNVSAPAGTNFSNIILANVGRMKNQGIEFNVNAVAIQTRDFSWELGYNLTWNRSRITKLTAVYNPDYPGIAAGNAPFATGTTIQYHQVGHAPGTFYLYEQVYDDKGHPIQNEVVDRNNDGEITQSDQYFTGKSPMPKVFMGLNSQFKYKNWDLGFNLRANFGNYVFNGFAADHTTLAHFNNQGFIHNYSVDADKYGWTKMSENYQKTSDLYLENASFLKLDNITVGYTFDKFFTEKISGRVSASVQNVFTITGYSGLDPETSAIDSNIWPRPRTFTVGLSLNF
jgi:iron complex outermembrane receptor protein